MISQYLMHSLNLLSEAKNQSTKGKIKTKFITVKIPQLFYYSLFSLIFLNLKQLSSEGY